MKEKLQAIGIGIVAWLCFFSAIISPWCAGIPAVLNLFGVYELPIALPFVVLFEFGIFNLIVAILIFFYIVLPVIMGVVFLYYTCIHLFATKVKIVTVSQEDVEKTKIMLDELYKRKKEVT